MSVNEGLVENIIQRWQSIPIDYQVVALRLVGEDEKTDWSRASQRPFRVCDLDGTSEYPVSWTVAACIVRLCEKVSDAAKESK